MENSLIEKFNKKRYRLSILTFVGLNLAIISMILQSLFNFEGIVKTSILYILSIGWALFIIGNIIEARMYSQINSNQKLKAALNDELYKHNMLKTFKIGFFSLCVSLLIAFFISPFISLPIGTFLLLIGFLGIMPALISKIVYLKN